MVQSDTYPSGDQEVTGSIPAGSGNILIIATDLQTFSTLILSLPLIQEGQLSVSGKRKCTVLVTDLRTKPA